MWVRENRGLKRHLKERERDDAVAEGHPPPPLRDRHPTTRVGTIYASETADAMRLAQAEFEAWRQARNEKVNEKKKKVKKEAEAEFEACRLGAEKNKDVKKKKDVNANKKEDKKEKGAPPPRSGEIDLPAPKLKDCK